MKLDGQGHISFVPPQRNDHAHAETDMRLHLFRNSISEQSLERQWKKNINVLHGGSAGNGLEVIGSTYLPCLVGSFRSKHLVGGILQTYLSRFSQW